MAMGRLNPGGRRDPARLLIVPGLRNSGADHWQSWLQSLHRRAVRVEQADWEVPDLDHWTERLAETLERHGGEGGGPWLVAAHSFGCLVLARYLQLHPDAPFVGALLAAPADPDKFDVAHLLPAQPLPVPSVLVASDTDPWMPAGKARHWASRWGSHWINLGDAGHINAESGFGPWPFAQRWATGTLQRLERTQRVDRAAFAEWTFSV